MLEEIRNSKKYVGYKQSLKAIDKDIVLKACIAKDADPALTDVVRNRCKAKGIEIIEFDTALELGKLCGIKIGAAVAVTVK